MIPVYRWRNRGTERLCDSLLVTQPESGQSRIPNLDRVSSVLLTNNTAKVKFNNTVLFLPLSSILASKVFFYLAGDKKSLSGT